MHELHGRIHVLCKSKGMPVNMLGVIFPTGKVALPPRLLGTLTDTWSAGKSSSLRVLTVC